MTTVAQFTPLTGAAVQDPSLHERHAALRAFVAEYQPQADRAAQLALQVAGAATSRAIEAALQRWQVAAHHPLAAAPGIDSSRLTTSDTADRMAASLQHIQTQLTIAARDVMDTIRAHEQTIRAAGAATLANSTARAALVAEIERQIPAALVQARQQAGQALDAARAALAAAQTNLETHQAYVPDDVRSWAATRQELTSLVEGYTLRVAQAEQASKQAEAAYATAHQRVWDQRIADAQASLKATTSAGQVAIARAKAALEQAESDAVLAVKAAHDYVHQAQRARAAAINSGKEGRHVL